MSNKKRNKSDQIVLAAIETIEEVDFLLMTELKSIHGEWVHLVKQQRTSLQ